jgi:hypothetical protein
MLLPVFSLVMLMTTTASTPLSAISASVAPASAAQATQPRPVPATGQENLGEWIVAGSERGCAIHASGGNGTVVSVIGFRGEDKFAVMLQNHRWSSLQNGERYQLSVEFDDRGAWPISAIAQQEIDADGPGLLFAVQPGANARGESFMAEFATARVMQFSRDGQPIGRVVLGDGHTATVALAQCMAQLWNGGNSAVGMGGPFEEVDEHLLGDESGEKPVEI